MTRLLVFCPRCGATVEGPARGWAVVHCHDRQLTIAFAESERRMAEALAIAEGADLSTRTIVPEEIAVR